MNFYSSVSLGSMSLVSSRSTNSTPDLIAWFWYKNSGRGFGGSAPRRVSLSRSRSLDGDRRVLPWGLRSRRPRDLLRFLSFLFLRRSSLGFLSRFFLSLGFLSFLSFFLSPLDFRLEVRLLQRLGERAGLSLLLDLGSRSRLLLASRSRSLGIPHRLDPARDLERLLVFDRPRLSLSLELTLSFDFFFSFSLSSLDFP